MIVYDNSKNSKQKKGKNIKNVRQDSLERTYDEWKIDDYVFTNKNKS
jgi:hypothetical protein